MLPTHSLTHSQSVSHLYLHQLIVDTHPRFSGSVHKQAIKRAYHHFSKDRHLPTKIHLSSTTLTNLTTTTKMAASPVKTHFTIPIPPIGKNPGGSITCTEPHPKIFLLTISSPPDNRLTISSCQAFLDALDLLEFSPTICPLKDGVVVTTSAIPKFYSNGLDLELAMSNPEFMPNYLYKLFARFLTFPMPTIALVNGHAFAAGIMLAMHHDYRVMNPSKGFVCINELDFGVPLKPGMSAIFRLKLVPQVYRKVVLEAHRFNGKEALETGIVDSLGGFEEVVKMVEERKLREKGKTGIYGLMKAEMYRETLERFLSVEGHFREEERIVREQGEEEDQRRERGEKRVKELGAKL